MKGRWWPGRSQIDHARARIPLIYAWLPYVGLPAWNTGAAAVTTSNRSVAHSSLHYIGEEALLLDPARQRLYALNACAAFIWSSLKDGISPADVSRSLIEQFDVPAAAAASYVADVLRQYQELRLDDATPSVPMTEPRPEVPLASLPSPQAVETYALLDGAFRVHYDSARLFEEIHPFLQHWAGPGTRTMTITDVAVASDNGGVTVIADNQTIGWCRTIVEAAVAVRAWPTQLAAAGSGALCAVHAGALRRNGHALLLPGDAGEGKSTLSAGLAARGFEMLSDDTTLLVGEPPLVRCIPAGLCIKRGAYAVLEPD